MRADIINPEFYSVSEAATVAGVSPMTIRRAIARGDLASYRLGRKLLVRRDVFRAWLESKRRAA